MDINSRFPDEVLSHIFVVGSWLAVDASPLLPALHFSSTRRPPGLKPFARLASSVCRKWSDIVHWESNRSELNYSSTGLRLDPDRDRDDDEPDVVQSLSLYLDDLRSSDGVDLDLLWISNPMSPYDYSSSAYDLEDSLMDSTAVKLFMHGMCMTLPYIRQVRILQARMDHPPVLALLYSMLELCGKDMQITLLSIQNNYRTGVPLKPITISSFVPAIPFGIGGSRVFEHLPSLCKLHLEYMSITSSAQLPENLLHLGLHSCSSLMERIELKDLCMMLLQARWLRTLRITDLYLNWLAQEPVTVWGVLPRLEVIELVRVGAEEMAIVLSAFVLPALTTLRIEDSTDAQWFNNDDSSDLAQVSNSNAWSFLRSGFQFTAPRTFTISPSRMTSFQMLRNEVFPSMQLDFVETLNLHLKFVWASPRDVVPLNRPVSFQNAISLNIELGTTSTTGNLAHLTYGMSFPALKRFRLNHSSANYYDNVGLHRVAAAWWQNVLMDSKCLSLCRLCELKAMLPTLADIRSYHPIWYSMQAKHLVFQVDVMRVDGCSSIELFGEPSLNDATGTSDVPFPCLATLDFELLGNSLQTAPAVNDLKLAVRRLASRRMEQGRKHERVRLMRRSNSRVLWSNESAQDGIGGTVSHY